MNNSTAKYLERQIKNLEEAQKGIDNLELEIIPYDYKYHWDCLI